MTQTLYNQAMSLYFTFVLHFNLNKEWINLFMK